jgi:hypothetical protein
MRSLLSLIFTVVIGCSSSSEEGPTTTTTDTGQQATTDTATANDTAIADTGAMETAADTGPEDITKSKECQDLCAAIVKACPSVTCDPKVECAVKSGHCVASTKPVLACKASTGSISCGSGGFSIVHSCKYDDSVCT